MNAPREVFVTVGKKSYSIRTPLNDATLDRLKALIASANGSMVKGLDQEELLMLTCLQLAYSLDKAAEAIEGLLRGLERAAD